MLRQCLQNISFFTAIELKTSLFRHSDIFCRLHLLIGMVQQYGCDFITNFLSDFHFIEGIHVNSMFVYDELIINMSSL